jgi:hypothetical protein
LPCACLELVHALEAHALLAEAVAAPVRQRDRQRAQVLLARAPLVRSLFVR